MNVTIEDHGDAQARAFEEPVRTLPEIVAFGSVAGAADFLLQVVAKDLDSYAEFAMTTIRRLPGSRRCTRPSPSGRSRRPRPGRSPARDANRQQGERGAERLLGGHVNATPARRPASRLSLPSALRASADNRDIRASYELVDDQGRRLAALQMLLGRRERDLGHDKCGAPHLVRAHVAKGRKGEPFQARDESLLLVCDAAPKLCGPFAADEVMAAVEHQQPLFPICERTHAGV